MGTNVIRRAEQRMNELKEQGINYQLVIAGRKAAQYFERRNAPIAAKFINLEQIPTADEAGTIGDELLSLFLSETVDRVELIYTRFISLISATPVIQTLLNDLSEKSSITLESEISRASSWSTYHQNPPSIHRATVFLRYC